MTLTYKGGGLDVGEYELELTVSGDAGLANRTAIADVTITDRVEHGADGVWSIHGDHSGR